MNEWAFWSTVHYLWLVFQTWPLVVYLEGPGFYGAGIPFTVSLLILLWVFSGSAEKIYKKIHGNRSRLFWKEHWKNHYSETIHRFNGELLIGFLLANVTIGHYTGYWTSVGYHFFDAGIIFWPVIALLEDSFPFLLAYPLTFFGMLADDVFASGQYSHWTQNFWFGVGGAGFHDGLFIGPLTALVLTSFFAWCGKLLRRKGFGLNSV